MRDRLIELMKDSSQYITEQDGLIERIADHLIANGVIVPPCKVGEIVYSIQGFNGKPERCEPYTVTDITIYENTITIHITDEWLFVRNMYIEDFGKTVFLTKEEAEAKLKGGDEQCLK